MTAPEPTVRPMDCTGLVGRVYEQLAAEKTTQADNWPYTVTFDGDTHWLECELCSATVAAVEAGVSLGELLDAAIAHHCEAGRG